MRVSDTISGLLFAAFGAAILIASMGFRSPLNALTSPGLFPMFVGSTILLCGLGVAILDVLRRKRTAQGTTPMLGLKPIALVVPAAIVFYIVTAPLVGTLLSGAAMVTGVALVWRQSLPRALILGLISSVAIFYFMGILLRVPLPRGFIERMLT